MTYDQIRVAPTVEAVEFLDAGKSVDQAHLRAALANALQRIARLEDMISEELASSSEQSP